MQDINIEVFYYLFNKILSCIKWLSETGIDYISYRIIKNQEIASRKFM